MQAFRLKSIGFYCLLFFAYPIYVLINSSVYSVLSVLLGGPVKLMLYGFTCTAEINQISLIFFTLLLIFKLLLLFLGLKNTALFKPAGLILFILLSFDVLSVLAYSMDIMAGTYMRFIFFASTPLYVSSYLYGFSFEVIPLIFGVLCLFYFLKVFKRNTKNLVIAFSFILLNIILVNIVFTEWIGIS